MALRVLKVAVPAPLRILFDYLPPPAGPAPIPGCRVRVPFGRSERVGVVWAEGEASAPADKIKRIGSMLDEAPLLATSDRAFLEWAARYYQYPLGEVVAAALPLMLRRGAEGPPADAPQAWRLGADPAAPVTGARQRAILDCLQAAGGELSASRLFAELDAAGDFRGALRRLRAKGLVEACSPPVAPGVTLGSAAAGPALTAAQRAAVDRVTAVFDDFGAYLLDGVTGSGKTEVYIALAQEAVARGRQVLFLVPEISLTPQLERRLLRRIPARFTIFHSGRNAGDRARAWMAAAQGEADILVGTRSAIFTPLPRLGLIIVDEEHDPSFKQQEGFRYSARDLAVVKARMMGCPLVLGSATPSLESVVNVQKGRYRRLHLADRVGGASLPALAAVDIRAQRLESGLSPPLLRAMRGELDTGNQVLLFLNRRGYAPVLTCHACGWVAQCPHCDARMTFHAAVGRLWCHHCGHQRARPEACPECRDADLRILGQGTERLEESLARLFPGVVVLRIDRDATRRKGSLEAALAKARSGEASLLVGTQMLAKGHHFPGVTLVGILDADAGLFGVDFRAPERTAQLLYQVAGRAGRAEKPGRVLVQTRHPDHPMLTQLIREGYGAFVTAALAERREASLPPFTHQALVRAEATRSELPRAFLTDLADAVRATGAKVDVWGPVPAPMERRSGRFRAHLLLQSAARAPLQACLDHLMADIDRVKSARGVRWSLDVDPVDLA